MELFFEKIRTLLSQTKYWQRTFILVWEAVPGYTAVWGGLLIIQGILPGVVVYLTKYVIESVVKAKESGGDWPHVSEALGYLGLIGIFLLLTEALQPFTSWIRTAQAEYFNNYLNDKVHQQAVKLDLEFYESAKYHDLMERARGDSSSKPLALLESFGGIMQNTITMLVMVALLATYGWWIPLVLLLGTLPAFYVSLVADKAYHRWWKSTTDDRRWTSYYDAMLTHADSAMEMRIFALSDHFRGLYQTIRGRLCVEKLQHLRRQNFGKIIASLLALITIAGTVGWMAVRVLYNLATLGDLGVFYQVFSRGQSLMNALLGSAGNIINNSMYLENLFAFLDLKSKIASPDDPHPAISNLDFGINFKDVSFHYPNSPSSAIRNFNLFVPAGSVTALVGVNGAGKSTLIKLLNRFYDPSEGCIEIDGVDLREFDVSELRSMMSVLFQFPMHYQATAGENIGLGNVHKKASKDEIIEIARGAGAHEFITRLPKQYDTLLGNWFVDGKELSGGEWQRLALARAYFRGAPIVVLDEPTSFMDSWAEVDWFDRFRDMVDGQTGIVITHRFTIAMRADIIHVIDQGKIIESGNHNQLITADGFYARSWKAQMQTVSEQEKTEHKSVIEGVAVSEKG